MFALSGCKESDDMPTPPEQHLTALDLPTESSTYEETMKVMVNFPVRANAKARSVCSEVLARHKKELQSSSDPDKAKKLALIDACQARIDTLAAFLKAQKELGDYVLPLTSPLKTQKQAVQELLDKKDAKYATLRKAFDDTSAAHQVAKQKTLDLGKEFIIAGSE